jgi:bifunctional non-homologous end joining protein LigD
LSGRPVTLKRYPDGATREAYWDKDAPSFTPDWVETFPVPRRAGGPPIRYILIQNTATLAWAANAAALELHPFLHRVPDTTRPTSVVFDLDPGEGVGLLQCIEVAFAIKAVLERLGLDLFPKVSGSKGLQVYVPLNSSSNYDITQPFARSIAQWIEREHPRLAISEMPKAQRVGKVFIDWSQNAEHKTTVGVYSLRAKQQRPFVSLPVTWDELRRAQKRQSVEHLYFDNKTALARLEKTGDLFAPVLTLKQILPENLVEAIKQQNKREGHANGQLREYTRKRDFSSTAEAEGGLPKRSSQGSRRRFVIQKHAASHLHYDFRLEIHGVLKSWAVPKGLQIEMGVRGLAAATEDHPLDYLQCEGVIPPGQDGGGTVVVWDIGTYEIIQGSYWKGNLHLSLNGKKLKGEWALTRDRAKGERSWVLEKVGESAKPLASKQQDQSALSKRTMAQIAATGDATWQSNRPAMPGLDIDSLPPSEMKFVEPMLAKPVSTLPEGASWQYEISGMAIAPSLSNTPAKHGCSRVEITG